MVEAAADRGVSWRLPAPNLDVKSSACRSRALAFRSGGQTMDRDPDLMKLGNGELEEQGRQAIEERRSHEPYLNELLQRSSNRARAAIEALEKLLQEKKEGQVREQLRHDQKPCRARGIGKEEDLYPHFRRWMEAERPLRRGEYLLQLPTSVRPGRWKNPDFYRVTIDDYTFRPGFSVRVETFEIKRVDESLVTWPWEGVFEARAHLDFANAASLVVELPFQGASGYPPGFGDARDELAEACRDVGIGLYCMQPLDVDGARWSVTNPVTTPPPRLVDYARHERLLLEIHREAECKELNLHLEKHRIFRLE
jgi:hypothetical protein